MKKTPRDILLSKHQPADAKLDKIRLAALTELNAKTQRGEGAKVGEVGFALVETRAPLGGFATLRLCVENLCRELVLPRPRAWAGVAGLWIVILSLKLSTPDHSPAVAQKTSVSPDIVAELKQQKAFFGELAGLPPLPEENPPKALPPRPRSARNPESSRA